MSRVWVIVLWSAIPVAVLLPAFTIGTYWFFRYFNQRRRPRELPVERAYREAATRQMAGPGAGNAGPGLGSRAHARPLLLAAKARW